MNTKVELAIRRKCCSPEGADVRAGLEGVAGVRSVVVQSGGDSIVVETSLPVATLLQKVEEAGFRAAVRGLAGECGVAIIETGAEGVRGVVRFSQEPQQACIVDGVIDGLPPRHDLRLQVHESGDLTNGCSSVGEPLDVPGGGQLGSVRTSETGRAEFRLETPAVRVGDLIGRALVVEGSQARLGCGIVARSAGLLQNAKTICACDGTTLWSAGE